MAKRTVRSQGPKIDVTIHLCEDGKIDIDPQFNKLAISHLDMLYTAADRDDYDQAWTDDHKVAFLLADAIEQVLAQWDPPETPETRDSEAPVPHISESPVCDVFDLSEMENAKAGRASQND